MTARIALGIEVMFTHVQESVSMPAIFISATRCSRKRWKRRGSNRLARQTLVAGDAGIGAHEHPSALKLPTGTPDISCSFSS